jgi:uncharacterized protein with GYD domain
VGRAGSTAGREIDPMAKYVTLYKFTDQGIRDIKGSPERIRQAVAAWEAMGGKLLGVYSTQGPYDLVAISEANDDEMAAAFALSMGSQGNVTTLTMRAFDPEEHARIVSKIP